MHFMVKNSKLKFYFQCECHPLSVTWSYLELFWAFGLGFSLRKTSVLVQCHNTISWSRMMNEDSLINFLKNMPASLQGNCTDLSKNSKKLKSKKIYITDVLRLAFVCHFPLTLEFRFLAATKGNCSISNKQQQQKHIYHHHHHHRMYPPTLLNKTWSISSG